MLIPSSHPLEDLKANTLMITLGGLKQENSTMENLILEDQDNLVKLPVTQT